MDRWYAIRIESRIILRTMLRATRGLSDDLQYRSSLGNRERGFRFGTSHPCVRAVHRLGTACLSVLCASGSVREGCNCESRALLHQVRMASRPQPWWPICIFDSHLVNGSNHKRAVSILQARRVTTIRTARARGYCGEDDRKCESMIKPLPEGSAPTLI